MSNIAKECVNMSCTGREKISIHSFSKCNAKWCITRNILPPPRFNFVRWSHTRKGSICSEYCHVFTQIEYSRHIFLTIGSAIPDIVFLTIGSAIPDIVFLTIGSAIPDIVFLTIGSAILDIGSAIPDIVVLTIGSAIPDIVILTIGSAIPTLSPVKIQ